MLNNARESVFFSSRSEDSTDWLADCDEKSDRGSTLPYGSWWNTRSANLGDDLVAVCDLIESEARATMDEIGGGPKSLLNNFGFQPYPTQPLL